MDLHDIEQQVIGWHRETFPNATIQAIVNKFCEEHDEFRCFSGPLFSDENMIEFADMCIVYMAGLAKIGKPSLSSLIENKLTINRERVWGKETKNGDRPRKKLDKR